MKSLLDTSIPQSIIVTTIYKKQMTSLRGHLRTKQVRKYFAILKLENGHEYFLVSSVSKKELMKKAKAFQIKLQCELMDEA